ncbi:UDP-glycosyltransferase 74D1 [Raphanus sativus]|nr:UDP-glycosyltransferase 74D1 [Raphanus sativus]
MGEEAIAKVLVFSVPIQGHINPLLQFSKRLISKNVAVTFLTTSSTHNNIIRCATAGGATALPLSFVPLDDGFEEGHLSSEVSSEYLAKFEENVSRSLSQLISSMEPKPNAVVYCEEMGPIPLLAQFQLTYKRPNHALSVNVFRKRKHQRRSRVLQEWK